MKQAPIGSGFDRDTSWKDIIRDVDLKGRVAVVTGGSAGLGLHTAQALGEAGADLVLGARSKDSLAAAKRHLEEAGVRSVATFGLDLTDPSSVRQFGGAVKALDRPVDILVANAGIMASPLARDARGNEFQLSTNYLGHALLVSELAAPMAKAQGSRLVSLSSTGHHYSPVDLEDLNFERRPYDKWLSYGQSKTASSLLAVKVARALGHAGVGAFAVHPGMIPTNLSQFLTEDDFAATREQLGDFADTLPAFKSLESGAATSVWAATAPALGDGGFAYCEDCDIAEVIDTPNYGSGVLRYAIDEDIADALWAKAEAMIGAPLPLEA